jgi:CBS domain-containing protein
MIEIQVEEIMSEDLVTVEESQSLVEAGKIMADADVKSVIVCDATEHPIGILTSTDFVEVAATETDPSSGIVADHMSGDIVTTTPETVVYEAADLMLDHNISHLPVVRDGGRLTGIVTTTDVAKYVSGMDKLLQEE